ncbi:hypothetical protein COLO4_33210 [Corchorus olitorius]|uniref:Transposase, Ptta/En/Spm, plant n=1 Tax=Corchorus olitorius TaxID=93759 RepID=A0A1R3GVH8_9ROSI|nr:hypothetical protein COLO4_33210 [Corchorus olitorius]
MPTGPIQSRTVQSRPTTTQNGHTAAPQVPHRRDHQDGTPPPPHHPSPPPPADGQPSHQHNDQPLPEQSESVERVLPPNLNGPQYVTLKEVFSKTKVRRQMRRQIQVNFNGPLHKWKLIPPKEVLHMFNCWKVFYCYDNQHHDQIWAEFQKVGSGHLRRKFKKQRDLPGIPPLHWVPEWAWNIMKTYWQSAAFKRLCQQAKQNRASMAGSVSWRGDPDQLYCRTHGIKDKLPAGRPQEILDEYNAALKQVTDAAGDDADAIARIDRRQIWKDTIGGSKGRTLGMGNLVNLYSTDVPDSIAQQNVQLRSTVQELQAEIVATNKRFAQLEENQRSILEAVQATLASAGIFNPILHPIFNLHVNQNVDPPARSPQPSEQQSGVRTQQPHVSQHQPATDANTSDTFALTLRRYMNRKVRLDVNIKRIALSFV